MATWRDRLQPASFRSIPFQVDADSIGVGRRTQVHEYTKRDKPYVEDLGRATRDFDVTGFVIGDDCFEQADKLLEAFEAAGPGELLHPWLGRMKVSAVGKPQFKRDRREGGMIRFDVSFVESGDLSFPSTSLNTSQNLVTSASDLEAASQSNFGKALEFVNTAKVNIASYMTTARQLYTTYSSQISPFVDAFTDAQALADFAISLPDVFAEELYSALDSITHVFTGTASALSSAVSISGEIADVASVPDAPGADTAAFQTATVQLTQDALLVDVMRELATIVVPVDVDIDATPGPHDPECLGVYQTFDERKKAVIRRLVGIGGQSAAYFVSVAVEQGYLNAKVTEHRAPRFRRSRFGKSHFGSWGSQFFWTLDLGERLSGGSRFGVSLFGERFGGNPNAGIECLVQRWMPAHTIVNFVYAT